MEQRICQKEWSIYSKYRIIVFRFSIWVSVFRDRRIYYGQRNRKFKIGPMKRKYRYLLYRFYPNLTIVASGSHLNEETKKLIEIFNQPNLISSGSSIKLLLVAEGKADIYPRLGPTSEWDTCAAHAVVKYAGGKVTKVEHPIKCLTDFVKDREELVYNKPNILNPYFIVS